MKGNGLALVQFVIGHKLNMDDRQARNIQGWNTQGKNRVHNDKEQKKNELLRLLKSKTFRARLTVVYMMSERDGRV